MHRRTPVLEEDKPCTSSSGREYEIPPGWNAFRNLNLITKSSALSSQEHHLIENQLIIEVNPSAGLGSTGTIPSDGHARPQTTHPDTGAGIDLERKRAPGEGEILALFCAGAHARHT